MRDTSKMHKIYEVFVDEEGVVVEPSDHSMKDIETIIAINGIIGLLTNILSEAIGRVGHEDDLIRLVHQSIDEEMELKLGKTPVS